MHKEISVSVVEDKVDIRNALIQMINGAPGMRCLSYYGNAEEALVHLPVDAPQLVLMDIGLPKMNGIVCMAKIAEKNPSIDFLMFTVFDDAKQVFEALKTGAIGYVLKGEGALGAIRAIQDYAAGGAPMSRNIARKVLVSFSEKRQITSTTFESLTKQQLKIVKLLADGLLNKEIADRLGITERTVKQHNNAIYKKLQVNNRTEVAKLWLRE